MAILLLILVALFAAPAQAAKPEPVEPSITLNESDPHLGSIVTFTAIYPPEADRGKSTPRIAVICEAGYAEAGPADGEFLLGGASSDWLRAGGESDCRADLFYLTYKPDQEYVHLASTEFHADG